MNLEPLPAIILAMAEQRSLAAVLKTIMDAVARQPDVALARLWLREPDEACPVCNSGEPNPEPALHLRASAGQSGTDGSDWSRINGAFHRILLARSNLKIAHMATTGESIRIPKLAEDHQWVRYPAWVQAEGLVSFSGHALLFRGASLGVLGPFSRSQG